MQQNILRLLEQSPGHPHSVKEVGKRVDRDRYREEPSWARPFLKALVEAGLVEQDINGAFLVSRKS
jgi:Fe2+ or Zn2+ uptake regulation protein